MDLLVLLSAPVGAAQEAKPTSYALKERDGPHLGPYIQQKVELTGCRPLCDTR